MCRSFPLVVPWRWWVTERGASAAAAGLANALLLGLVWAPVPTLLAVAVLHNWTPVPLVAEALPATERRRFLGAAIVVFGVLPLALATGLPAELAGGMRWPDARILPSGSLMANLTAYLPVTLARMDGAVHWFSAIVFAQCLHYVLVIGALPRWSPPASRWAVAALVLASAVLFLGYAVEFRQARLAYGIVASVHAWVEVPLMVLLLLPPQGAPAHP